MKKVLLSIICLFVLLCMSCSQSSHSQRGVKSFEIIKGDTFNLLDAMGKQGVWVPSITNKLKDTVIYRNDSIIKDKLNEGI